nr:MAG TPA: hypothetical protein [Caudoviricetes sp.]
MKKSTLKYPWNMRLQIFCRLLQKTTSTHMRGEIRKDI